MKNFIANSAFTCAYVMLIGLSFATVEAGRFGRRQPTNLDSSPYNKTGQPLTRFGYRWVERKHEQDARVAQRTGKSVDEVTAKRLRRLEMFGAAVEGLGAGLGAAADSMNYSQPSTYSSGSSTNYSRYSNWGSFNRNYSRNPDHAPVGRR